MEVLFLGIRHHGPGSAKRVLTVLDDFKPDLILVEGPPELGDALASVSLDKIRPPVAVLGYNEKNLKQAVFYPFAIFSPEWQAFLFAQKHAIELRCTDLPLQHTFGMEKEENPQPRQVFIGDFARLDNSSEDIWWDNTFEHANATHPKDHFDAVFHLMETIRQENGDENIETELREAFMREALRQAKKEKFERVVFIGGAYHMPALKDFADRAKTDRAKIKGLSKTKVSCAWIPWSNSRLGWTTGYGAGIESPGWFEHVWKYPDDNGKRWIIKAAQAFRQNNLDISSAHIIEAVRLAQTLAYMRGYAQPKKQELEEAMLTVMCNGQESTLYFVLNNLLVGKRVGSIPKELSQLPIQKDFEAQVKSCRLQIREDPKAYEIDLRKPAGIKKSILLHQLSILDIEWAVQDYANTKGTFKERWTLCWQPEVLLQVIDKGIWGNEVAIAATNYLLHKAKLSGQIQEISNYIQVAIKADLEDAVGQLVELIQEVLLTNADVAYLMGATLPLVEIRQYSSVRKTSASLVEGILEAMFLKIFIGLPTATLHLDEDSANDMFDRMSKFDEAIRLVDDNAYLQQWFKALQSVALNPNTAPVVHGCANRLLFDNHYFDDVFIQKQLYRSLSIGMEPKISAQWLEGFLRGSAMILVYDDTLWGIVYDWIKRIEVEMFDDLLPLLRRTFSNFDPTERTQLGQKVLSGKEKKVVQDAMEGWDTAAGIAAAQQLINTLNKAYG